MADGTMFTTSSDGHAATAASSQESTSNEENGNAEGSLSLDHALLESLFYNEMMLMDDSSPLSTDFLSYISGTDTNRLQQQQQQLNHHPQQFALTSADPSTLVERDLLRDFGVSSLPTPSNGISSELSPSWPGMLLSPPTDSSQQMPYQPPQQHIPQQQHLQHVSTSESMGYINGTTAPTLLYPPGPSSTSSTNSLLSIASSTTAPSTTAMMTASFQGAASAAAGTTPVSQERAKQLVSQFATLASRLGIELPQTVLQSLIVAAATNESTTAPPTVEAPTIAVEPPAAHAHRTTISVSEASFAAANTHPRMSLPPVTSPYATAAAVYANANGAESLPASPVKTEPVISRSISAPMLHEAMAAVTLKRTWSGDEQNHNSAASVDSGDAPQYNQSNHNNNSNGSQAPYSKRRKKANLSECEARLAALKAENEMLKRHLDNVSNQTHKIDQERQNTAVEMRRLLAQGATPEQIDAVVDRFSETYSDYGRHRHQELTFHLDQLQRLATPTNFTKMGLWTLGQTGSNGKSNPLAGILQRDLGITPQQGRKILEQRQKIKDVCANLKECLALLAKLKTLCEHKTRIFHDRMNKAREILNPMQVVRLLIWIDEHSSLLAHLCPGWGSEHIVLAKNAGSNTNNQSITPTTTTTTTTTNTPVTSTSTASIPTTTTTTTSTIT